MKNYLPAATAALALGAFASWWLMQPSLNSAESALLSRLKLVTEAGEPRVNDIVGEFGLPQNCATSSCEFDGTDVRSIAFADGNFRSADPGLVFVLDDLQGQCVRVDRIEQELGQGSITQGCSDSVCWYYQIRHDWGIVSFGLEAPDSSCAKSVVINSDNMRPKPGLNSEGN